MSESDFLNKLKEVKTKRSINRISIKNLDIGIQYTITGVLKVKTTHSKNATIAYLQHPENGGRVKVFLTPEYDTVFSPEIVEKINTNNMKLGLLFEGMNGPVMDYTISQSYPQAQLNSTQLNSPSAMTMTMTSSLQSSIVCEEGTRKRRRMTIGAASQMIGGGLSSPSTDPSIPSSSSAGSTKRKAKICRKCNVSFSLLRNFKSHECGVMREVKTPQPEQETIKEAINRRFTTITLKIPFVGSASSFFDEVVIPRVKKHTRGCIPIKIRISISVELERLIVGKQQFHSAWFSSKMETVLNKSDLQSFLSNARDKIMESLQTFTSSGSGWRELFANVLEIKLSSYNPTEGSSYIPLPPKLANKKAIINVKNQDAKCFLWSVLAAVHPAVKNAHRVSKYTEFENSLDMSGITYPVKVSSVDRFENRNSLAINIFSYKNGNLFPMRVTKRKEFQLINLLLLINDRNSHYCYIKNFNRLFYDFTNNVVHCCFYCLHRFSSERTLNDHKTLCSINEPTRVRMPTTCKNILEFDKFHFNQRIKYVVYADFETLLKPRKDDTSLNGCTTVLNEHVACSYAFIIVDNNGKVVFKSSYLDRLGKNDVVERFLRELLVAENIFLPILKHIHSIDMSQEDENSFNSSTNCHICTKTFTEDDQKVRDHDHTKEKNNFRGAAHNKCNLLFRQPTFFPVFLHNMSNFDGNLIIPMLGIAEFASKKISCIPKSMNKFISFTWGNFRFLDSYQFLNSSLDVLVENLGEGDPDPQKFPITSSQISNYHLACRKGVYPYEFMDSNTKFSLTSLPEKDKFYSSLKQQGISDSDFAHAQLVWDELDFKDLGEYCLFYNLTDCYLLADCFESFRTLSLKYYKIDPGFVVTAPSLTWQAMLRMTGVKLELITDIDIHLFLETGLRGGLSASSHRLSTSNNPLLGAKYNSSIPTSYIAGFDCNSLYATAMTSCLPQSNFHWLEDVDSFELQNYDDDGPVGFFLDVDLSYPRHLHDKHSDYPLAPEHLVIHHDLLSPYAKSLNEPSSRAPKLVTTLGPKKNYVVHFSTLKLYTSLGLKVDKIHRILAFDQSAWLAPYVEFNIAKRQAAKNNFEKSFFKLLLNAVYGRTLLSKRKQSNIEIVTGEKRAKRVISNPSLKDFEILNSSVVIVNKRKTEIYLDSPIFVGIAILDIAKNIMYNFHYNFILSTLAANHRSPPKLLYTDTDSLYFQFFCDDLYADIAKHLSKFDTSDYPKNHPLYRTDNKKVLGKFSDETSSAAIYQMVAIKAKMYSVLMADSKNKKIAKGVCSTVVSNELCHQDYLDALQLNQQQSKAMVSIRKFRGELVTLSTMKKTLSAYDDKRYIQDDGINTLAYYHYSTFP